MSDSLDRHNIGINLDDIHNDGAMNDPGIAMGQDNVEAINNVSQYGDYAINIGSFNGNLNVYADSPQLNSDYIVKALCHLSNLRHSKPTLTPVIPREKTQEEIIEWINKPSDSNWPKRIGFITGSPGVGKTAFTNMLYSSLSEMDDCLVWGIKVDQIEFQKIEDISKEVQFHQPFTWVIKEVRNKFKRVVVIIDQIDALSLSLSSDRTPLISIVKFIQDLNEINGVRVIVSCRDYDIDYDPILSGLCIYQQRWRLGDFTRKEVIEILEKNGRKSSLSDKLLDFLGNPLNLSLYLKIGETGITISPLNINSLYDIVWQQDILDYSSKSKQKLDLISLITGLAQTMHDSQRISVPSVRYESRYNKEIRYLISRGFLRQNGSLMQFSHQTLFDYVYARIFVESGKSILEELKNHHQGLFIRSQIHSVLLFLRSHDQDSYILCIREILSENNTVKFHIKVLTLTLLAYQESPLESELQLLKSKIWDNSQYGHVFLNALNSQKWFEAVLTLIDYHQGWNHTEIQYRKILISSILRAVDFQFEWSYAVLEEIIKRCDDDDRNMIFDELQRRYISLPPESLRRFYIFLKSFDSNRFYPLMLENLIAYDPNFVAEELKNYLRKLANDSAQNLGYHFNIGYEWEKVVRKLEAFDTESFLSITIDLVSIICQATQYEYQLYDIKSDSVYHSLIRTEGGDISHHSAVYLYNFIINSLVDKKNAGEDIKYWLRILLGSEYAPLVCAGLNVLIETRSQDDDIVYAVLSGKKYLTSSPPWVQYYSIELLKASFKYFNAAQQKAIVDNILSIESSFDKLNAQLDANIRMEHNIPISYQGWDLGVMLNAIPTELLKNSSSEGWLEWQRLNRKFKHLENEMPSKTSTMIGWQSMSEDIGSKMGIEEWRRAMRKYNTDISHDFKTPTLTGQCNLFQKEVSENPDKYKKLIFEIFDDEDISMKYILAGIEGLIEAERINDAATVTDHLFSHWIGKDINKSVRDFSLHGFLFAVAKVFNHDDIPSVFFQSIKKIVLEADDSKDMERFSGSDILTHSINTSRGNATERLVLCVKYPQYRGEIFDILEKIAPSANVSTRAAALINLALLNNIDKDRNVELFKSLLHDFNPLLLSMPLHNLNPLVYFVRYAFNQLTEYFDKVVETPESHKTQINILWLAHINKNKRAMGYIRRIQAVNPNAMAYLVSFLSSQNCYDKESILFVTELVRDLPYTSELATAVDSYFNRISVKNITVILPELEDLLTTYPKSNLAQSAHIGYLDLLKKISVIEPRLTLTSLFYFIDNISEDESYKLNKIVEILINSYNTIRKYNDPDDMELLDKAIDHMDALLRQTSGPSYLNNYINHIDNG